MPLHEKFKQLPDCHARELLKQLPLAWQESLCCVYDGPIYHGMMLRPQEVYCAAFFEGSERVMVPADAEMRAIFDELTEIFREEMIQHRAAQLHIRASFARRD